MEFLIVILILGFILWIISAQRKNRKRRPALLHVEPPLKLGIHLKQAEPLVNKLESSIPRKYEENLRIRLLKSNPSWTEFDFKWRFFELKRYFVLNSLLKTVPMFSDKVDEVWHEMLMFTKEYERFSHSFYNGFLHHTPNMEVTPIPGERAFFDWVYLCLFEPAPNSRLLWGPFLKHPIKKEILEDFQQLSDEQLLEKYFRQDEEGTEIKDYLIKKLRSEIDQAKLVNQNKQKPPFSRISNENQIHHLLPAMVFFSIFHPDDYENQMALFIPQQLSKDSVSSSGCSGFACASSSDSHDGGNSSCSGSSCGGGCS